MRASDIVLLLHDGLPQLSNLFSDEIDIVEVQRVGNIVTVTTLTPHNMILGQAVNLVNVPVPFAINSLTWANGVATAITDIPHDLIFNDNFESTKRNVDISGVDQPEYNGSHKLLGVPNRKTFEFEVGGNPVTPATGPMFFDDLLLEQFNGLSAVSLIVSPTQFQFVRTFSGDVIVTSDAMTLRKNVRVSAAATYERAVAGYTPQRPNEIWAFIVLENEVISKDRSIVNDATTELDKSIQVRIRNMERFSVYIFVNTINSISGRPERDEMEDVKKSLFKVLIGAILPSEMVEKVWSRVTPVENGFHAYNTAYYVHRFLFERMVDITSGDINYQTRDVAFRDLCFDFKNENGVSIMGVCSNLDVDPLES